MSDSILETPNSLGGWLAVITAWGFMGIMTFILALTGPNMIVFALPFVVSGASILTSVHRWAAR